ASRPSVFQTLENGVEVLLAKQAHADGNIDLGVQNVLSLQPLHQSIRDQFVVGGSCEVFRDVAKGNQEAREVRVLVELLYVSQRTREAVGLLDFEQGGRLNRTFEVQMQLSLRQGTHERARVRVGEQTHGQTL